MSYDNENPAFLQDVVKKNEKLLKMFFCRCMKNILLDVKRCVNCKANGAPPALIAGVGYLTDPTEIIIPAKLFGYVRPYSANAVGAPRRESARPWR